MGARERERGDAVARTHARERMRGCDLHHSHVHTREPIHSLRSGTSTYHGANMVARGSTISTSRLSHLATRVAAMCAALALGFAAPATASAATIGLSVETMSALSDAVVLARVTSTSARQLPSSALGRGAIVTDVDLAIESTLKGSRPAAFRLTLPGGVVGDVGFAVDEVPEFYPGERCILFLGATGGVQGGSDSKLLVVGNDVPSLGETLPVVLARVASGVQGYRIPASVLGAAGTITAAATGPVVTGISPQGTAADASTTVTITGRGFGATAGTVTFFHDASTRPAAVVSAWSDVAITCSVPNSASSGPVIVTTSGGLPAAGFPFLAGYAWEGNHVNSPSPSLTYRLNSNCGDPVDEAALATTARAMWNGHSAFTFIDGGSCTTTLRRGHQCAGREHALVHASVAPRA
jgi:hypothetical protein